MVRGLKVSLGKSREAAFLASSQKNSAMPAKPSSNKNTDIVARWIDPGRRNRHHAQGKETKRHGRGTVPGSSGIARGFIAQDAPVAVAKASAANGEDEKAHRQLRSGHDQPAYRAARRRPLSPIPPKGWPSAAARSEAGKYRRVATKQSEIRAPPPKPLKSLAPKEPGHRGRQDRRRTTQGEDERRGDHVGADGPIGDRRPPPRRQ